MQEHSIIQLEEIGSSDIGYLSFFESCKDIPFAINRIYFTYAVPENGHRGMHAHKKLQQVLWCPFGSIEVLVHDGNSQTSYKLDTPSKLLYIDSGLWRDIFWLKENSVLIVAASDYYKEDDYIRNFDEFKLMANKGYWRNGGI